MADAMQKVACKLRRRDDALMQEQARLKLCAVLKQQYYTNRALSRRRC